MHIREFDVTQLPRARKQTGWLDVATRADGSVWKLPLLTVTGAEPGPTLVVTAAVHGNEYEGVETIPHVFRRIQPGDLQGTLVMVPVCNVPAYETMTRSSTIDGLNLARVFPGNVDGTVTERIAYWITEILLKQASFFIDLHSGGMAYDIATLIGYSHHATDPVAQQTYAAARAFGAPVLWGHPLPLPPGRSISAAAALGVPALYTEAPGGGYAHPDDVACFTEGVINVMKQLGMLDGTPQPRPLTHHLLGHGDLDTVSSAAVAGFFRAKVSVLDKVTVGQTLGTVYDLFGNPVAEVQAEQTGVVIMLRRIHPVNVGEGLVHVTGLAP